MLEAFEAGAFALFATENAINVAVRPAKAAFDAQRRLHCADGPAFAWLDDVENYYWHGVRVPSFVVEAPHRITLRRIDRAASVALRRVMIDRYKHGQYLHGPAAYIRDAGGREIDYNARYGALWHCWVRGDEPLTMLEVVNSSPEHNGSFKHYWLRVPPWITTARQAVAWTFSMRPNRYAPRVET